MSILDLVAKSTSMMGRLKILVDYLSDHRTRILMYHNIVDSASDPWAVPPRVFALQMDWLATHGYTVLSLRQVLDNFDSGKVRRKSIVLTFDDGYADFLKNAVPILSEYQYPATLFIVAGAVGGVSGWRASKLQTPLLNWEEIQEIAKMGYEIGSHGLYHQNLTKLCDKDLETEVEISKELIEDHIGTSVSAFSYPWGAYGIREIDSVKRAGYDCAVTVGSKWENGPETDRFRLERKTMQRGDSLGEFARKVGGHERFHKKMRHMLGRIVLIAEKQ